MQLTKTKKGQGFLGALGGLEVIDLCLNFVLEGRLLSVARLHASSGGT